MAGGGASVRRRNGDVRGELVTHVHSVLASARPLAFLARTTLPHRGMSQSSLCFPHFVCHIVSPPIEGARAKPN